MAAHATGGRPARRRKALARPDPATARPTRAPPVLGATFRLTTRPTSPIATQASWFQPRPPIEPAGAIGGLGWNQLACVAIGLVGLVVSLNVAPSTGGALVGLAVAGSGLASAFLRLAGRPPVAWAAIAGGYAARRARGRHRHSSGTALRGHGLDSGEKM